MFGYYRTSFGDFKITEEEGTITKIEYIRETTAPEEGDPSPTTDQAARELQEYFAGSRKIFEVSMSPQGTDFQKAVWQALTEIPYGEVRTYGQIAARIGSPKGARAVGVACHNNPIMIMIPCHRVIGKNGALTGYAGGLDIKERLLKIEKAGIF